MEEKNIQLVDQLAISTIQSNFKNQAKKENKNTCSHDIIILLGWNDKKPIYRCLFCQESDTQLLDFAKSIVIDSSNYYKESFQLNNNQSIEHKLFLIRNQIMKFIQYSPNITNGQLECMINQSLNGYSYKKQYRY